MNGFSEDPWAKIKNAALRGARDELHGVIQSQLPEGRLQQLYASYLQNGRGLEQNPLNEEDEGEDDGLPEESPFNLSFDSSLSFEFDDAEQNLDYAVAAYRLYGTPECIVAQHKHSGMAFFGVLEDLEEVCTHRDTNTATFTIYEDPTEVMNLHTNADAVRELIRELQTPDHAQAKEMFEKFHWGDESRVSTFMEIPGISGDLTLLGVGRMLEYGVSNYGSWETVTDEFGGSSEKFPMVYALGEKVVVLHGDGMNVDLKPQSGPVPKVPGVTGELTLIGVGKEIQYGAMKNGSWQEYYHHFGENTKVYPMVYALDSRTLVIYGGKMRVEPRGIVE